MPIGFQQKALLLLTFQDITYVKTDNAFNCLSFLFSVENYALPNPVVPISLFLLGHYVVSIYM